MGKRPINQETEHVLEKIKKITADNNFYLAGGTALAIQLEHRESIDLDWFSTDFFSNEKIKKQLGQIGNFKLDQEEKGTIHGSLDGVKITFLHYKYRPVFPLIDFKEVKLADERDIAAMKLDAISSRGSKKDFIDLYFLLEKYSLKELFEFFENKYKDIEYNKIHLIKSLLYFEEAEQDPMPIMIKDKNWQEIKEKIKTEALDFLKSF
jgi:hypothetical protein